MTENDKLQMFEDRPIRTAWDETQEEWYFSIVDVVTVLTESGDYNTGRKYWNKLKQIVNNQRFLKNKCHFSEVWFEVDELLDKMKELEQGSG